MIHDKNRIKQFSFILIGNLCHTPTKSIPIRFYESDSLFWLFPAGTTGRHEDGQVHSNQNEANNPTQNHQDDGLNKLC